MLYLVYVISLTIQWGKKNKSTVYIIFFFEQSIKNKTRKHEVKVHSLVEKNWRKFELTFERMFRKSWRWWRTKYCLHSKANVRPLRQKTNNYVFGKSMAIWYENTWKTLCEEKIDNSGKWLDFTWMPRFYTATIVLRPPPLHVFLSLKMP